MRLPLAITSVIERRFSSRSPVTPTGMTLTGLLIALLPLTACSFDSPTEASVDVAPPTSDWDGEVIQDLEVSSVTGSSIAIRWTQVDDGAGEPARYQIKHAVAPFDWESADVGCDHVGEEIGAEATCVIEDLAPNTAYDIQLMAYRNLEGPPEGSAFSEVVSGETGDPEMADMMILADVPTTTLPIQWGVWIKRTVVRDLPRSGSAWNNVKSAADEYCGWVDLSDLDSGANVCVMAKALVFARTHTSRYRTDVVTAIDQISRSGTYYGTALALGRNLAAFVIAADLIDLKRYDPELDERFRRKLRSLRTTYTSGGGAASLIECHERRPNNWGAHCGATRAAIAVYLNDTSDIARTARVLKGYLGDRTSYRGFSYGSTSWQCDPDRPVGINLTCYRDGVLLRGVLPDDQRRGGSFQDPPPKENYVWEALQGLLVQAVILNRAGYDVWAWRWSALRRAGYWLHDVADYPAEGDDTWQPYLLNYYYGTSFPAPRSPRPGKNVGWTDWTHAR